MNQAETTANYLKEAKQILDKLGVKFWLTLGTSLGAYRDHDFCPGDIDDIDLCIDYEFYPREQEIADEFIKNEWILKAKWEAEDKISTEYSFYKQCEGFRAKVDLWYYTPNPKNKDELLFRMYREQEISNTFILPKRFYESFQEIEFYGEKYLIPEDIEGYLEYNYGTNWRTPIERKDWDYYTSNYSKLWVQKE